MNRKVLYIIIAVLAVILLGGLVFVFVMSNADAAPTTPPAADVIQTDAPTGGAAAADPTSQTDNQGAQQAVTEGTAAPTETTEATEATEVTEATEATEATDATDATDATQETQGTLIPDAPVATQPADGTVTYLDYINMTGAEQMAFINTFSSYDAFFTWFNAAKEAYEDGLIEVDGSTPVDGGNLNGN